MHHGLIGIILLALVSCGGNSNHEGSSPKQVEVATPNCQSPSVTLVKDGIQFRLATTTAGCAHIYLNETHSELEENQNTLLPPMSSALDQIDIKLEIRDINYLVSYEQKTPGQSIPGITSIDNGEISVSLDHQSISYNDLLTALAESTYKSRRQAETSQNTRLVDALVTEGLSMHFLLDVQQLSSVPVKAQALDSSEYEQTLSLAQATAFQTDFSIDEWFFGKGSLPEYAGYSLGYAIVEHYLSHKPGSTAARAFALPAEVLFDYLTTHPTPLLKSEVYVRTPDINPAYQQVPIEEFARQANKYYGKYVLEGYTHDKKVALTFDDGPNPVYTPQILEILKKYGIRATFFITGVNLNAYPEIAMETYVSGHTLANHSYKHGHNARLSPQDRWDKSIEFTNRLFEKHLGFRPRLIRPPYGEISDDQVNFIYNKGMHTILWSIDTRDWLRTNEGEFEIIEYAATDNFHEEAIILMHDAPHRRENTVAALENIILHYKSQGYDFVTVDELIGVSPTL